MLRSRVTRSTDTYSLVSKCLLDPSKSAQHHLSILLLYTLHMLLQWHRTGNYGSWNILSASCLRLPTRFPLPAHSFHCSLKWTPFVPPSCSYVTAPSCLERGNAKMIPLDNECGKCFLTCSQLLLDGGSQEEARSCHLHIPSTSH